MKLIAEKRSPRERHDQLRFVRADGSGAACMMPRQGILPHDLLHYVVESALGCRHGFLGLVAAGAQPAFAMDVGADDDSAKPGEPDAIRSEAARVEALVEAMQAQLWAGVTDDMVAFRLGVEGACASRGCAPPALDDAVITGLFEAAAALAERWNAVPPHGVLELELPRGSTC